MGLGEIVAAVLEDDLPCISLHSLIGSGRGMIMHFEYGDEMNFDVFFGTDGAWRVTTDSPNLFPSMCGLRRRRSAHSRYRWQVSRILQLGLAEVLILRWRCQRDGCAGYIR